MQKSEKVHRSLMVRLYQLESLGVYLLGFDVRATLWAMGSTSCSVLSSMRSESEIKHIKKLKDY